MPYIQTFDRTQMMMLSWDLLVEPESIARLIDAFVDSLDLKKFTIKEPAVEGRPAYDPRGLYKLYIYGNRKGIRSSRKLAESCKVNLEIKWMMGGVEPDFRTISDFRKDNIDSLKEIFHEFNRRIAGAVEWGFSSVDGSKFQACNSKDRNFTKNKLDDRIAWLNGHAEEYLRILNDMDQQDELEDQPDNLTKELVEAKLKEAQERLERYQGYQELMEQTGASQLSLTDADAKLMKSKNGFIVGYNPQTVVDSETHLIRDFQMTNRATDHGLLYPSMEDIRTDEAEGILELTADKGYEKDEDLVACLESGVIPHVIMDDGKDAYELETEYEEHPETDAVSTCPDEIKKCLRTGQVPEAYKDVVSEIQVTTVRHMVYDEPEQQGDAKTVYGTPEEMKARAMEGYFVRDPERNLVYCPSGEILRQKCVKKNGNIRYSNKNACRHCANRNKCYKGRSEWKEIDFTKDKLEKPCRLWLETVEKENDAGESGQKETEPEKQKSETGKRKGHMEERKIVRFKFSPNRSIMSQRMCLSEHPFGTIKRAMGASYFLLKGMRKVTGEFALFCLGYNIERAKNLLGFKKMMELMAGV